MVVDYRRGMLGEFDGPSTAGLRRFRRATGHVVGRARWRLRQRLPGPDVTPSSCRPQLVAGPGLTSSSTTTSWSPSAANPLLPLLPFLAQARDVGLHLYVARRAGGASRALLDPVLGAMRELNFPAVLLSAPRDELQIFGLRPGPQPPGRGDAGAPQWGTVPVQLARQSSRGTRP